MRPTKFEAELIQLDTLSPDTREIRMELIPDIDDTAWEMNCDLIKAETPGQLELAARLSRYFSIETGHQYQYVDHSESRTSYYFVQPTWILVSAPLAAGCICLTKLNDAFVVSWIWIHPFERSKSRHALPQWWKKLSELHPDFALQLPLSKAMEGLLRKHDLHPRLARE